MGVFDLSTMAVRKQNGHQASVDSEPPAEWILMPFLVLPHQPALCFEHLHNFLVRVLVRSPPFKPAHIVECRVTF